MYTGLKGKHLIYEQEWEKEELEAVLDMALEFKKLRALKQPHKYLDGRTLFLLFFEESTRTRNAFETGITQLGGHANYLIPKLTQIDHGEGPKDTVEVLSRYGEGIGIRNTAWGIGNRYMRELAKYSRIPVINLQCDLFHPTQALADLLTLKEKLGDLRGRKFVMSWTYAPKYVRPISMPQSIITLMTRFGLDVTLAHPPEFFLLPDIVEQARENARKAGSRFEIVHDMEEAFKDADVIYAKSWGALAYTQDEPTILQLIEKYPHWKVTEQGMQLTREDSKYMHCMPIDRGIEVENAVADGPHSVIYDEAENRLHIAKAIMALTME